MYDDPQVIHEDKDTMDSWVNDELTWNDVYSKKPVEYLEAIARGEVPRWDSDKGGYVYGSEDEATESFGGSNSNNSSNYKDPQADSTPDEDLPF
jgi:hypothetical protein